MNKIDELIQQLCPDGVPKESLGQVCIIKTGQPVSKVMISKHLGEYPVINSGREPLGFINQYNTEDDPIGITSRGAGVGSVTWCLGKYYRGNLNYSVTIKDAELMNVRFLYYLLTQNQSGIQQLATYQGIPALNKSNLEKLRIPIPPLDVQKEIVSILDKFTQLDAELSAELIARRKQYDYYRNQLLTIGDAEGVRRTTLGEIGTFTRGNGPQKKDFTDNGIGCIHYGQIYTHYGTFTDKTKIFVSEEVAKKSKKAKPGNVVIATTSENDEDVCKAVAWLGDNEIAISNHTAIFAHNENPKYMAYLFQTQDFFKQKKKYIKGTKVKDVSANSIAKFNISLPLRDEQDRIVDILDNFDALTSSISEGLPAEITARRKQYEYYRTKLLTFQELPI